MFHSSEVHEKPFHRVVPMNRLHFIDLKNNLMGNSYKEDLVVYVQYIYCRNTLTENLGHICIKVKHLEIEQSYY